MQWYDWLISIVPVLFVLYMGFYSRRYLKDVTAFLSAGRVCGRYVIMVGDVANGLAIITLLAYVEVHYKTGFALAFWNSIMLPLGVLMGLYGYVNYRFRETKAQSIGQFLEMRYSRRFRVFAAALRVFAEVLANMIMPALAARFFMYFLDLPPEFTFLGIEFSTFNAIMVVVLVMAISIICFGGAMAIIVTDTIQGFICYPLMALFVVFVLWRFSWSDEIMPVLSSRVEGENFLNPYDISHLRDFNYFSLFVALIVMLLHRGSWLGAGASSTAAKTPHEQKMAGLLGTWRGAISTMFYVLIAVAILTFMNHGSFAPEAHHVRQELSLKIANDIIADGAVREKVVAGIRASKGEVYRPGEDAPQSDKDSLDSRYLAGIHDNLVDQDEKDDAQKGKSNSLFQQFRTLYHQQLTSAVLRNMLPTGMLGLFCLLMIMAMISTDDSRIFSSSITISQDVILPFIKKQLTPEQHLWMIRGVAIGIGALFLIGSSYMAQLDYIQLYGTLVTSIWLGGCGPVITFGLYTRFGNTLGAWASLLGGGAMALFGALVQRNWADAVYPWLAERGLIETTGRVLGTISRPFNPIVVWEMDAIKCPVNSYEWFFITMMASLVLYFLCSWLGRKIFRIKPFNLQRMLHRGKYSLDGERVITSKWTWKNLYNKLIGITPEYSFWDKVIAWAYFLYSFAYRFLGTFVIVVIWNVFDPWPLSWWGYYFLIVFLVVPGVMAAITAVWFGICGVIDLRAMFRDLRDRVVNPLDDGRVEGNMSLADKAELETIDQATPNAGAAIVNRPETSQK